MNRLIYVVILGFFAVWTTGCQQRNGLAPVSEAHRFRDEMPSVYRVQRYDTLYSIAFRYDQDYRSIAHMNQLYPPYALRVGQLIRLKPQSYITPKLTHPQYRPALLKTPVKPVYSRPLLRQMDISRWQWPSNEKRVWASFAPERGQKGIDVLGRVDSPVFAANAGVVAYAGDGLGGYGNLIIIKHNDRLLTAYAHGAHVLVKEGQHVQRGQKIATMGLLDRQHHGVHFEVREWGKPVNPLRYLTD